jgi:acyl-CoA thioesterase I
VTPRVPIVALGDSTTAGTPGWRSPLDAPPAGRGDEQSQYGYWLIRAHPEWDVLNRGVNGERTDQILARVDRDVLAPSPRLVIVVAGVNDIYQGRSVDEVTTNLRLIYDRAEAAGILVVAGSILPFNTATPGQNRHMHLVNEWIAAEAARDPGVAFVETRQAVAVPGDRDRLISSPDELHPSADGYRLMAEAIRVVVERMLMA